MPATRPVRPTPGIALSLPRAGDEATQRAFDRIQQVTTQLTARAGGLAEILGVLGTPAMLELAARLSFGAAAPTTGAHEQGEIVIFNAPVAGGFIGTVCVASGSPGTWKSWGAIQP